MVLASALEPLRDVKIRSLRGNVAWVISTLDGEPVKSSSGIRIAPDEKFDAHRKGRTLVLVSGYQVREQIDGTLKAQLRQAARHTELIVALDTGAWLLASAGLLDGQHATIHWQELDAFEEAFPRVSVSRTRFVRSGQFITCGGASTALDMTLDLIKSLFGSAAAFDASTMFVFDPAHQYESHSGATRQREDRSPKVLSAINAMAENIETPMTTFQLADRVKLSERTLNRTFMREFGITPGRYYKQLRLQRARYLAEETYLTLEQIALRCGFSSATALGRSFTAEFGFPIKSFRNPKRL